MTLSRYLLSMVLTTIMAWIGWFLVLYRINPEETGFIGLGLFYLTLLFGLTGIFSIFGLGIRAFFQRKKDEPLFRMVWLSFRQAISYALILLVALYLIERDLFSWWNMFLLILFFGVLEYFLLSSRTGHGLTEEEIHEGEI